MKSEDTLSSETWNSDEELSSPHFDDEATVQSARPVVHLRTIKAGAASKNRLRFGLAIIGAALVGVLAATLFYKQKATTTPGDSAVLPAPSSSENSSPLTNMGGVIQSRDVEQAPENIRVETPDEKPRVVVSPPTKPASRRTPNVTEAGKIDTDVDESREEYEAEMRRAERREARRLRRQEERQSRRRAYPRDDLFRIREIFEGSPRP